jgi:hypothetical protein
MALATAASLLAGFLVHDALKPTLGEIDGAASGGATVAWGWAQPGAIAQDVPADDYLRSLAEAAEGWFAKRPEDAAAVSKRILEFRQGCSTLQLSDHRPLDVASRRWLRSSCRQWAEALEDELARLEAGARPADARYAVDHLARRIASELRKKADQLEG